MSASADNDPARATFAQGTDGIGDALRRAREARGLSRVDLAYRIKLEPRVIEQLESDAFDKLPPAAFVRGYLRALAKELELDVAPLLAYLDAREDSAPPQLSDFESRAPIQITSESKVIRYTTIALGVVMIVLVAAWWRGQGGSELEMQRLGAEDTSEPATPLPYEFRQVEHPDTPSFRAAPEPAFDAAPTRADADERADTATATAHEEADVGAAIPAGTTAAAPATAADILIRAREESWIDVSDASGRRLYFDLARPGRELSLTGEPPYTLVIGNAPAVDLRYRGAAIELAPHAHEGVARLRLEP